MLSADVQAVISAYYSRNLREEVKKGFYGRLKQGFYPMPAPLGYLDAGAGKPKSFDPVRAPLVKTAFELYATGRYSQSSLAEELHALGLRNKSGHRLERNFLGRLLRNPFYMGVIRIEKTSQTYLGAHKPLVSKKLFEQVQSVLLGNFTGIKTKHEFVFRQLLSCKLCGRSLIPESQKGHTYYRCQGKLCPTKCVREELIEQAVVQNLKALQLDPKDHTFLKKKIGILQTSFSANRMDGIEALQIKLAQAKDRMDRLTDAYLDSGIDRETFEQRKTALLMERRDIEDRIQDLRDGSPDLPKKLDRLLELIKDPYLQYIHGCTEEKRELVKTVCSNRTLSGKTLDITLSAPFAEVAKCRFDTSGGPSRANARTWNRVAQFLHDFCRTASSDQKLIPIQ